MDTRAVATVAPLNMQPEIGHALLKENVVAIATSRTILHATVAPPQLAMMLLLSP